MGTAFVGCGSCTGATAGDVLGALQADVAAFAGATEPADDLTLLCLRWIGPGHAAAR